MHAFNIPLRRLIPVLALGLLAGCEGLFTGERAGTHALTQREDGSFAPLTLQLTPDMNPIAINFKGMTIAHPNESSRWNTYNARLTLGENTIAASDVTINNTGTQNHDQGGPFASTLFFVDVPAASDYQLTLALAQAKEITIEEPTIEIRRNTQPPPK